MAFGAMNARRPGDDWSTRDIVIHLSDAELVEGVRLRRVLAEERPALEAFDQDLWKRRLQTLWRDTDGAIASFELVRWQTAEILAHCDRAAWAREGVHAELGVVSAADLVRHATEHAEQHAEQIPAHSRTPAELSGGLSRGEARGPRCRPWRTRPRATGRNRTRHRAHRPLRNSSR